MMRDLVIGDQFRLNDGRVREVVSTIYVPFPKVGVNCMTAEGNYYVLTVKKEENGAIMTTRNHLPGQKFNVI